jgi:hypothetical protein
VAVIGWVNGQATTTATADPYGMTTKRTANRNDNCSNYSSNDNRRSPFGDNNKRTGNSNGNDDSRSLRDDNKRTANRNGNFNCNDKRKIQGSFATLRMTTVDG